MRRFPPRPALAAKAAKRLADKALLIVAEADRQAAAERIYTSSRQAKWFEPITSALKAMTGPGERCMLCSGSECSQVEHFRPKAAFPLQAMDWENFLWVCGLCNLNKGERFPPHTEPGEQIINPVTENVWDFFFIDEFGNLTERWRPEMNCPDPRAHNTVGILGLDRDALQQTRQSRLKDLRQKANDTLALYRNGDLTVEDLRGRVIDWIQQPFQPDVADYFLKGPGSSDEPFLTLLREAGV